MGVSCQILVNKPTEGVFKSGQVVSGLVRYGVDKPTEYKSIILALIGKGKCQWTVNRGKRTETCTGTEEYLTQYIDILTTPKDSSVAVIEGDHEFPFQFMLPENIPSSYNDSKCTINYNIKLKFVKPSVFKSSTRFKTEIPVVGHVTPTAAEGPKNFGLEKTLFKPFSSRKHNIDLKAEIDRTVFTPGDNANIVYVLTNNTGVIIKYVVTALICKTTYIARCGETKKRTHIITETVSETPSIPDNGIVNLSAVVPVPADVYSYRTRILVRDYKVMVSVRLPLPYIDAKVEMPILVGKQPVAERPVEEFDNKDDDQPPSYWEVMCEDKDPGPDTSF